MNEPIPGLTLGITRPVSHYMLSTTAVDGQPRLTPDTVVPATPTMGNAASSPTSAQRVSYDVLPTTWVPANTSTTARDGDDGLGIVAFWCRSDIPPDSMSAGSQSSIRWTAQLTSVARRQRRCLQEGTDALIHPCLRSPTCLVGWGRTLRDFAHRTTPRCP